MNYDRSPRNPVSDCLVLTSSDICKELSRKATCRGFGGTAHFKRALRTPRIHDLVAWGPCLMQSMEDLIENDWILPFSL